MKWEADRSQLPFQLFGEAGTSLGESPRGAHDHFPVSKFRLPISG